MGARRATRSARPKARTSQPRPDRSQPDRATFARRFIVRVVLWILPVAIVWTMLTRPYNLFLTEATQNLVRLVESPSVTRLAFHEPHHFLLFRSDRANDGQHLSSVRITDTHFPLIMLGAFFLATPGFGWRQRLEPLGWAALISVFFHLVSLLFKVHWVYATQLGAWSAEHYSVLSQTFWGMGKHLLDLPFKFALPLLLWAAFFLHTLLPAPAGERAG